MLFCEVDCEWGEWELGDCSKSCGGGIRLNYREKTVHEMFGGKCEGYPTFEEHCSPQNCPGITKLIEPIFDPCKYISNCRYLIHEKTLINLAFKLIVNGENGKLECVQYPVEEALKLALDQN